MNASLINVIMTPNELRQIIGMQPDINHCDMYVKEDDVKRIVDKYKEGSDECKTESKKV